MNKRPYLVVLMLGLLAVSVLTIYVRTTTMNNEIARLQEEVIPYTRESFAELLASPEFMRAYGPNILEHCSISQTEHVSNPAYLATFRKIEGTSTIMLTAYAHANMRHVFVNSSDYVDTIVFIMSSSQEDSVLGIENRFEQQDIIGSIGYIDTFCTYFIQYEKTYSYFFPGF